LILSLVYKGTAGLISVPGSFLLIATVTLTKGIMARWPPHPPDAFGRHVYAHTARVFEYDLPSGLPVVHR